MLARHCSVVAGRLCALRTTSHRLPVLSAVFSTAKKPWDGKPYPEAMQRFAEKIASEDAKLRKKYYDLPREFPEGSQDPSHGVDHAAVLRKRMIYRSKQRGMLEVDLILGKWSADNLPTLSDEELLQYEKIMNAETQDIFGWITGRLPAPASIQSPVLDRIKAFAQDHPFGKADPMEYEKMKRYFSN